MTGNHPTPKTTLAIVLGASEYRSAQLDPLKPASNAARDIAEYLVAKSGMQLPRENLLDLFDSDGSPNEINERIGKFLQDRQQALNRGGSTARDLIFYYVGHGGFTGGDRAYFLAIRTTAEGYEGSSSLRMEDVASTLKRDARALRRYLVLDCCFAAQAYKYFQQSSPAAAIREETLKALPPTGTALLCASTASKVALSPKDEQYPMFSGVLLDVLRQGNPAKGSKLSLAEIGAEVLEGIKAKFDQSVRPVVSSPDEREGDIAHIPLFPNASKLEDGPVGPDIPRELPEPPKTLPADYWKQIWLEVPPDVRGEHGEIKIGFYVALAWFTLVSIASVLNSYYMFFAFGGVGYGISASLVYALLGLGTLFLLGAMRLGRRGIFLGSRPDPPPTWWNHPEIQRFVGRRYWRFLALAIVAAWFELGLVVLFITCVTTTLFRIFGPGRR